MTRKILAAGFGIALLSLPAIATAQQLGELVVTAERREGGESQPHVVLFRRADNLITEVVINCDTRDDSDRLGEVKATLAGMIAAAGRSSGAIDLSVQPEDDGILLPLKLENLASLLKPGPRPDTSVVTIVVKTKIRPDDSFEAASGRIESFVKSTKIVGRSLVSRAGDWQLTVISPGQYRPDIVSAIAKDAAETMKPFGAGYGVTLVGLEAPVYWNRSGALELALYIPYHMTIAPTPAR